MPFGGSMLWPWALNSFTSFVSMNTWLYVWLCGGRRMGVGESFDDYRSVFSCVVKFSTLRNTKETLANFSKIPRVSLFRVPIFLVYAWSSFGSISTQETRSKRLDVVEAKNPPNLDSFRHRPFPWPCGLQTASRPKKNL